MLKNIDTKLKTLGCRIWKTVVMITKKGKHQQW